MGASLASQGWGGQDSWGIYKEEMDAAASSRKLALSLKRLAVVCIAEEGSRPLFSGEG